MATLKIKDGDVATKYLNVIEAGTSSEPHESVIPDYRIPYAINQIFVDDAVTVSVREKAKSLIKFGRNSDLDIGTETVWEVGGDETYPTGNDIDIVVSDDAGDTQDVVIEGHTLSGSDFTFVTQTATLNGTTNVALTTPLARASRLYNNDSTDFTGTVTVEDNGTSVHLSATGTSNQSLKCATTLSSVDYWIITGFQIAVTKTTAATVDFELQIREYGKTFRTRYYGSAGNGSQYFNFDQPIIAPPNSDIRAIASSLVNNVGVSAAIHGYLAIIT